MQKVSIVNLSPNPWIVGFEILDLGFGLDNTGGLGDTLVYRVEEAKFDIN